MKKLFLLLFLAFPLLGKAGDVLRLEAEHLAGSMKRVPDKTCSGGILAGKWRTLSGVVHIPESGTWSVWVRCSALWEDYIKILGRARAQTMRHFSMEIHGKKLNFTPADKSRMVWLEQKITLPGGSHKFTLKRLGADPYIDVIVFTRDKQYDPTPDHHIRGGKKSPDNILRHVSAEDSNAENAVSLPVIKAPVLDGNLDDPGWKNAYSGELELLGSTKRPRERTRYWMGCDRENLYIAFRCSESRPQEIKRIFTHAEDRDNSIFMDDCVELFVNPFNSGIRGNFHIVINPNGIFYDACAGNKSYQSNLRLQCRITPPGWVAEIAVPFSDFGFTPKGAEAMMINLARERQNRPREYSCLRAGTPRTGFGHLSHFTLFRPETASKALSPVIFFGFGSAADPVLRFRNRDTKDKKCYKVTVASLDEKGRILDRFSGFTTPGKNTSIRYQSFKHTVSGIRYGVYEAASSGKKIYSNTFSFPHLVRVKQTREIKNPLCESLFSKQFPRQIGYNGFLWLFSYPFSTNVKAFCYQYGAAYDLKKYAETLQNTGMLCLLSPGASAWWQKNFPTWTKKVPFPVIATAFAPKKALPPGLDNGLTLVPEVKKLYLQAVREAVAKPGVYAFSLGDEISQIHERRLINAMYGGKKVHPSILVLDQRIKKEFGSGRYGIPRGEEKDPLAWIAYRRFLDQELDKLFAEAAGEARKVNPDIKIVSADPVGNISQIYDFTKWGKYCDVVTHQLYPRNENVDYAGMLTRYLADLSGVELVWPCPHVEEYAANFTPSEVLDELSSAIRNGANGFQLFLNDSRGRFSKIKYLVSEYWGAPDRYGTLMNVMKYLKTMPKLQNPGRDAAIFTATDSLRACAGFTNIPERDVFLHGFLGNGAKVNYSFINESKLADLQQFRIIFSSQCKYIPEAALKKLQEYVRQGGTLVLLDPEAFSFTPEGKSLAAVKTVFTGIASAGSKGKAGNIQFAGEDLPFRGAAYRKVKLSSGGAAAAVFANGDAAIVRKQYGKGTVFSFTATPCSANLAGNSSWNRAFANLASGAGCQINCPVWHFRLPEKLRTEIKNPSGICLTGNFTVWRSFKMDRSNNSDTGGYYRLSPEPDRIADADSGFIPFHKGKLTDRSRAAVAPGAALGASRWTQWVIAYKPGKESILIDFKFNKKLPVRKARLWCSGAVRDCELYADGKKCTVKGKNAPSSLMEQIELILPQPVLTDKAQIRINGASKGLIIAETELWSE